MSWERSELLSNGATATIWRTTGVSFDLKAGMVNLDYCGYLDKSAMVSGKDALIGRTKPFPIERNVDVQSYFSKIISILEASMINEKY